MLIIFILILTLVVVSFVYDTYNHHDDDLRKTVFLIFLFVFSIAYGFLEQSWLSYAGTTGPKVFMVFSKYHIYMFLIFFLVSAQFLWIYRSWFFKHLPLMFLIEDLAYHWADKTWPNPESSINWPHIGFYLKDVFIPGGYIVLIVAGVILYYLERIWNTINDA